MDVLVRGYGTIAGAIDPVRINPGVCLKTEETIRA